jgi:hypothetical protein
MVGVLSMQRCTTPECGLGGLEGGELWLGLEAASRMAPGDRIAVF